MRNFYLDLCCLDRPFDEQHQPRVRLETEAVLGLIQLALLGELRWVTNDTLEFESSRNTDVDRRAEVDIPLGYRGLQVHRQRSREAARQGPASPGFQSIRRFAYCMRGTCFARCTADYGRPALPPSPAGLHFLPLGLTRFGTQ